MNFFKKIKDRLKKHPISSTLFFILFLVIITLAVPYFQTSNKNDANEELINSITNHKIYQKSLSTLQKTSQVTKLIALEI